MKNNWLWIVGTVVLLALLFALPFAFRSNSGGYGMMNGGMMGGFSPFGGLWMGLGMLLIWIVPLGLLFLVIWGAVSLAIKPNLPAPTRSCPNCGKPVQNDWKNCPHCGTAL
ncbi:MAG: zinc ribbon domain-containing protein [Chloroflexi bacterium]|nr:zinc ribbon domain-containing protein [Chloroflexota bacterium]